MQNFTKSQKIKSRRLLLTDKTMNFTAGFARIFTVLHYILGALAAVILAGVSIEERNFSVFLSLLITIGYYLYLEFDNQAKTSLGKVFSRHPFMTGLALLWTDIFVPSASFFLLAFKPYMPPPSADYVNIFTAILLWAAPVVLVFGGWYLLAWVARGFSGRE